VRYDEILVVLIKAVSEKYKEQTSVKKNFPLIIMEVLREHEIFDADLRVALKSDIGRHFGRKSNEKQATDRNAKKMMENRNFQKTPENKKMKLQKRYSDPRLISLFPSYNVRK
jgi:hypothetical protein